MIDSERLSHIRESVLRDSGRNFEDAYADRAWLLKKLDEQSSKLDDAQKNLADLQERSDEYVRGSQRADEFQKRRIKELESRLDAAEFTLKGVRALLEVARGCTDSEAHETLGDLREMVVERREPVVTATITDHSGTRTETIYNDGSKDVQSE